MRFARYVLAGAVGTALQYAILVLLVQTGVAGPVVASTIGALAGAAVNYLLNHRFTFASRRPHLHAFPRFASIALAGMAVNAALLAFLVHGAGFHYVVAQVAATLVVLGAGYAMNRALTF